jgi:hypothetical protein
MSTSRALGRWLAGLRAAACADRDLDEPSIGSAQRPSMGAVLVETDGDSPCPGSMFGRSHRHPTASANRRIDVSAEISPARSAGS